MLSSGAWVQPLAVHLSTVQVMPSAQLASPQQSAQRLVVAQHACPVGQS
jgi:hypothetical protein